MTVLSEVCWRGEELLQFIFLDRVQSPDVNSVLWRSRCEIIPVDIDTRDARRKWGRAERKSSDKFRWCGT